MYVLNVSNSGGLERYFIEPTSFSIKQYKLFGIDNKQKLDVGYSNYTSEQADGKVMNFPNKIVIKNPEKQQQVFLDYDSKEINKKDIYIRIKVPKSAKIIKWN
jgi:hypothetical protein